MIEMFHGLAAYTARGGLDPVALAVRAKAAIGGAEVCTSDRPIGKIGLVVWGELTALHCQDVWSRLDSNGNRVILDWDDAYRDCGDRFRPDGLRVRRYAPEVRDVSQDNAGNIPQNQAVIDAWCRDVAPEHRTRGDYAEGWIKASGASCVWVRVDADDATYWMARSLAKKLRVALVEVEKTTRIWNFVPPFVQTGSYQNRPFADFFAAKAA